MGIEAHVCWCSSNRFTHIVLWLQFGSAVMGDGSLPRNYFDDVRNMYY